jgi:hypothetical protein
MNDFQHLMSELHSSDTHRLQARHLCPFNIQKCPFIHHTSHSQFSSIITKIHLTLQHPLHEQQIMFRKFREQQKEMKLSNNKNIHNRFTFTMTNKDDQNKDKDKNKNDDEHNHNSNNNNSTNTCMYIFVSVSVFVFFFCILSL